MWHNATFYEKHFFFKNFANGCFLLNIQYYDECFLTINVEDGFIDKMEKLIETRLTVQR